MPDIDATRTAGCTSAQSGPRRDIKAARRDAIARRCGADAQGANLSFMPTQPGFYASITRRMEGQYQDVYTDGASFVLKVPQELRRLGDKDVRRLSIPVGRATATLMSHLNMSPEIRQRFGDVIPQVRVTPAGMVVMDLAEGEPYTKLSPPAARVAWRELQALSEMAERILDRDYPGLRQRDATGFVTGEGNALVDPSPENFRFEEATGRIVSWFDPLAFRGPPDGFTPQPLPLP